LRALLVLLFPLHASLVLAESASFGVPGLPANRSYRVRVAFLPVVRIGLSNFLLIICNEHVNTT
ncbi:hypothetical protein LAM40_25840, partial [Mycobacterium tuberculosis]|nr:hypothetical protein [Mycobacterium tuberculosis]